MVFKEVLQDRRDANKDLEETFHLQAEQVSRGTNGEKMSEAVMDVISKYPIVKKREEEIVK